MSFQMSDDIDVCKGYKKFSLHIVFVTFLSCVPLQADRRHDVTVLDKIRNSIY